MVSSHVLHVYRFCMWRHSQSKSAGAGRHEIHSAPPLSLAGAVILHASLLAVCRLFHFSLTGIMRSWFRRSKKKGRISRKSPTNAAYQSMLILWPRRHLDPVVERQLSHVRLEVMQLRGLFVWCESKVIVTATSILISPCKQKQTNYIH